MALIYFDSMGDNYTGATVADRAWIGSGASFGIKSDGRHGYGFGSNNRVDSASRNLVGADTYIIGMAVKVDVLSACDLIQLKQFSGTKIHVSVGNQGTAIQARRGGLLSAGSGTILGTSDPGLWNANIWHYLEVKVTRSDTVGVVVVHLDGAEILNLTGQDTNDAGTTIDYLTLFGGAGSSGVNWRIDDFYVNDTSGSAPYNDFLGDITVESRLPNGNGNSSAWVGSDADSTDNYLLVDETTPNADTDYVESNVVDDEDTYAFEDLATLAGTVYAVQILPRVKKTDAGTRTIKAVARTSSTEEASASDISPSTSYQYFNDIRTTKPGGGAWSVSDFNASEFGMKVT